MVHEDLIWPLPSPH